ncbi:MAG: hypothetical protein Q4D04_06320, partial [Clostridia bacterium]|nr:hypothetical protein [Clostridia bacterium]
AGETIAYNDAHYTLYTEEIAGDIIDSGDNLTNYIGSTLYYERNDIPSQRTPISVPARPDAPKGIAGGVNEITGVNETMQYKLAPSGDWTDCPAESVENAEAGVYHVRLKATEKDFASETAEIMVIDPLNANIDTMEENIAYNDAHYTIFTEETSGEAIASGESIAQYTGKDLYFERNDIPGQRTPISVPARPDAPTGVTGGVNEITGVDATMQYKPAPSVDWTDCPAESVENAEAGVYCVRLKATEKDFASETAVITVIDPLNEKIDFANETIVYNDAHYTLYTGEASVYAVISGTSLTEYIGSALYCERNDMPGIRTALPIPARPEAPEGVTGGVNSINGASAAMEYRRSSANAWTPCEGDVTGLDAGIYYVRYRASANAFASRRVEVEVILVDWDEVMEQMSELSQGDIIEINLNGETNISAPILNALVNSGVTLVLRVDETIAWTIKPADIERAYGLNIATSLGGRTIPAATVEQLTAGRYSIQLSTEQKDELGLLATIGVSLGEEYALTLANVYAYEDGVLKYAGCYPADETGLVSIPISKGGEYLIVPDDYDHAENISMLSAQYILLEVGTTANLAGSVSGAMWTSSSASVAVDEHGVATAVSPGDAMVVARMGKKYAVCRVEVIESLDAVVEAVLEVKELNIPIYSENGARIGISLTTPAKRTEAIGSVVAVSFANDKAAAEYTIEIIDDRNYAIKANAGAKKRSSAIDITLSNGKVIATKKLTLIPDKKLPNVKGIILLEGDIGTMRFTGAEVLSYTVKKSLNWLTLDESTGVATLTGTFRKNKELTVEAVIDGWSRPVTVKVSVTRTVPKPTLSVKTVRLFANDRYSTATVNINYGGTIDDVQTPNEKFAVTYLGDGVAEISFRDNAVRKRGGMMKLRIYTDGNTTPTVIELTVKVAK